MTLGGGFIVDPFPLRRHRPFLPDVVQRLEQLARGTPEEVLLQELEREQPCDAQTLVGRSALGAGEARKALRALLGDGQAMTLNLAGAIDLDAVPTSSKYVMSLGSWEALLEKMTLLVHEYHQRYPLRIGMSREELKSRLHLTPRAFNDAVAEAVAQNALVETETVVALVDHRVVFSTEQQRRVTDLMQSFTDNPYAPPSLPEAEAQVGSDVLAALIEQGRLVKVSDTVLFLGETYQMMTQSIVTHLQREERITLAQVRDMFNTSRKYAQALLEHLDEKHVTKRVGDERILR